MSQLQHATGRRDFAPYSLRVCGGGSQCFLTPWASFSPLERLDQLDRDVLFALTFCVQGHGCMPLGGFLGWSSSPWVTRESKAIKILRRGERTAWGPNALCLHHFKNYSFILKHWQRSEYIAKIIIVINTTYICYIFYHVPDTVLSALCILTHWVLIIGTRLVILHKFKRLKIKH